MLLYFVVNVTLKIGFHQAPSILVLRVVTHGHLDPVWLGGHSLYSINIIVVTLCPHTHLPQIHLQTTCYYTYKKY